MRDRDDYTLTVKELKQDFLSIQGAHDNFFPMNCIKPEHLPKNHQIITLKNSGHIGFIEEKQAALQAILAFCQK